MKLPQLVCKESLTFPYGKFDFFMMECVINIIMIYGTYVMCLSGIFDFFIGEHLTKVIGNVIMMLQI